jgi:DNA/RNA-binding domain of Phe-tRNA-synthetase-like protein
MVQVEIHAHPHLDPVLLSCSFEDGLGNESSPALLDLLGQDASAPMAPGEEAKKAIRDMLRWGGFKPAGRSKPASEYLIKAAEGGFLGPINKAVDVCNVVSLHSGLPVSVVDLDRVDGALSIKVASQGSEYVFNSSGQTIDLGGLICLFDEQGPCANAVKDSQRTKTDAGSKQCLYVIWGTVDIPGRAEKTAAWAQRLLRAEGARNIQLGPQD